MQRAHPCAVDLQSVERCESSSLNNKLVVGPSISRFMTCQRFAVVNLAVMSQPHVIELPENNAAFIIFPVEVNYSNHNCLFFVGLGVTLRNGVRPWTLETL